MSAAQFDSYTLSLSIDQTLEEFLEDQKSMPGMRIWENPLGDREKILSFRHEFAHFASYVATGLADLVGVFFDYKIIFLDSIINHVIDKTGPVVEVPILIPGEAPCFSDRDKTIITVAFNDINNLLSYYVGLGSELTHRKMFDLYNQTRFWSRYWRPEYDQVIRRFYSLITSHTLIQQENYLDTPVMPAANLPQGIRLLSSRSVIEAYALCIELINRHFKGIFSSANKDNFLSNFINSRKPIQAGEHYTVAIEYFLQFSGLFPNCTLDMFLAGKAPHDSYYALLYLSFAALQIPLIQIPPGEVVFMGTVRDLSPCSRFFGIVGALREGRLKLPDKRLIELKDEEALAFLSECHNVIGDTRTMEKYELVMNVREILEKNKNEQSDIPQYLDPIQVSINGHANFYTGAADFIKEGGLFSFKYPCEVAYLITSNNKLINTFQDRELGWFFYLLTNCVYLYEAAVFNRLWETTCIRLSCVEEVNMPDYIRMMYCYRKEKLRDKSQWEKVEFKKR